MILVEKIIKVLNSKNCDITKKFIINHEYNNYSNEVKMEENYLKRLEVFSKHLSKNVKSKYI